MPLFFELKRRNVFRVAAAYIAASWLVIQVADTLFDVFGVADEWARYLAILLAVGFPIAIIISWFYELTPEGVMSTKDAGAAGYGAAIPFGRQIDFRASGVGPT